MWETPLPQWVLPRGPPWGIPQGRNEVFVLGLRFRGFLGFSLSLSLKNNHVFIGLHWILVVAHRVINLHWSVWDL